VASSAARSYFQYILAIERTKHRPIADGRVSVLGASAFLVVHLILLVRMIWRVGPLGFVARYVYCQPDPDPLHRWKIGLIAIFPLPGLYPLMKRVTYWPQAWLGE
jgi:4-hydroxybenzoate polyprenyltransferase